MSIKRKYWKRSIVVTAVLSIILVSLWVLMNNYRLNKAQLPTAQSAKALIQEKWARHEESKEQQEYHPLQLLKTGVYVQSLQFFNSIDVNVTGYIWQKYECTNFSGDTSDANRTIENCKNKHINIPKQGEVGFILPEQVNSGSDIEPKEVYRKLSETSNYMVIGWYFEATLRQPFEYETYPFDHKTVWIRLWPKDFSENLVLFPDYDAYDATDTTDIFGIEKTIVLGTWEREDTYFNYEFTDYDTNFGIEHYIGKTDFPELRYNFVIKRKFGNAFIIYLLPLFLVAVLLFAAMLTVTDDKKISDKIGFNVTGFIGASSALFFVVMLAHIQLREQFAGSGIVYIEYFYILMYAFLVISTTNTYLFSSGSKLFGGLLLKEDNLIPKVAFWPVLIASLIIITIKVMVSALN